MTQPQSDTAFRKRPYARELSAPHLRALRKELLIVRAEVERTELAQAAIELRQTVTHFSWLKFLLPGLRKTSWGFGRGANAGIGGLLKQYPFVSSLTSILLAKPLRQSIVSGAKPLLKWGSLAFAAWEGYRIWQQMRDDDGGGPSAQ